MNVNDMTRVAHHTDENFSANIVLNFINTISK